MLDKILIANRGEIALRIQRACRELGIKTVAVYSKADAKQKHVLLADESVCIGPPESVNSYLNMPSIISAAEVTDSMAIHPGYGFLAENGDFAEQVEESGYSFIGPKSETIKLMGNKINAKDAVKEVEINCIPGSDNALDEDMDKIYQLADEIGYPVLIKAAAGGGGKGMRIAHTKASLQHTIDITKAESKSAFGDDTIFMEKLLEEPRHIEFQVLADQHGNAVCLGDRDCSMQRNHQKIIEEAPAPKIPKEKREEMIEKCVSFCKHIGYQSAGTLEFLYENNEFYFIEMNTRLQVEHPVTEMITGVDLVQKQLEIASGLPLGISQDSVSISGHSIEARIYAEDPKVGFLPAIGKLALWRPPSGPGIRVDSGVKEGDEVTVNFDPMLAKLIVHAPSRMAAIRRLELALSSFVALGVTTNIGFLRNALTHPAFISGNITTDFLDNAPMTEFISENSDPKVLVAIASAAKRLGAGKSGVNTNSRMLDDHSGHAYDPFITLSRRLP